MNPNQSSTDEPIIENMNDQDNISGEDSDAKPSRRSGRRKIKIEYIEDKNRRHITFSKRKAGIMKKAYELSTLTGTQVLLLVVSETGLVYTFTTVKLQPIVTKPEGKNLIQACLNAPDTTQGDSNDNDTIYNPPSNAASNQQIEKSEAKTENVQQTVATTATAGSAATSSYGSNSNGPFQSQPYNAASSSGSHVMPPMSTAYGGHPNYMNPAYHQQQQSQQQQSPHQQQSYSQMPASGYYGNQQQQYIQHPGQQQQQQQQQPQGYWADPVSRQQQQEDDKRRALASKK
ncbi:hypothetical protein [Parasitella parasitica]|uniref:MADS-box domain-containing protein n=1 Tax=Parasitella parasitica TaxID=35722 RepID=A0A0B7NHI3_9FUNG|nr:hypothetical protein [Parasitella parasitica]